MPSSCVVFFLSLGSGDHVADRDCIPECFPRSTGPSDFSSFSPAWGHSYRMKNIQGPIPVCVGPLWKHRELWGIFSFCLRDGAASQGYYDLVIVGCGVLFLAVFYGVT